MQHQHSKHPGSPLSRIRNIVHPTRTEGTFGQSFEASSFESTSPSTLTTHHKAKKIGVGIITFKPTIVKINENHHMHGTMYPYCEFKIGAKTEKCTPVEGRGLFAVWSDQIITLPMKNQEHADLHVKDDGESGWDDDLGTAQIPLEPIVHEGSVTQWIPILKDDVENGEVLIEMSFTPASPM